MAADGSMRYYIYVSDTKVDMLLSQMPSSYKKAVATSLNLDLKVFGSGVQASRKAEPPPEDRFSRLQLVERYLRDHEMVGNVEQPAKFVSGRMNMCWAPFNTDTMQLGDGGPGGIYFGCEDGALSIGLLGSIDHLIGARQRSETDARGVLGGTADALFRMGLALENEPPEATGVPRHTDEPLWMVRTLNWGFKFNARTSQPVEFLAKPFWYGFISVDTWPKKLWVLVGSPLYVAFAD